MESTAKMFGWDRSTVTQSLKELCFPALVEAKGGQTKVALTFAGNSGLLRAVELQLADYDHHLQSAITPFHDSRKSAH